MRRRNPHRIRRDRWGRDLEFGDLSGEAWPWRLILPWGDHFTVLVCTYLTLSGLWELTRGQWGWVIFDVCMTLTLVWGSRRLHHNRRVWRETEYLFNAWEAVDGIDGREGP